MIWAVIGMAVFAVGLLAIGKTIEAEDVKRIERLRRKRTRF